jgi:DNA-binding NtrC family response regulator
MFQLRQLIWFARASHRKAGDSILRALAPGEGDHRDPLRVLALTEDQDLLRMLREIAESCSWKLAQASTVDEAVEKLESERIRLVLLDHDPSGPDWRIAMRRFNMLPNPVCVFVVSKVGDQYLWDEVVRHHGYDVLPKPLRREQVIRSLELAWYWRAWQQQWTGDRKRQ